MFGTLAHNGFAIAPQNQSLNGEAMHVTGGNTIVGLKTPPTSVERGWVAQYINLEEIDRHNRVLAFNGVNMDLAMILYELAKQENSLRNTCIVDVNGEDSCGLFHFQQITYEVECKSYDFGENMDKPNQVKCALKMIMEGKGHTTGGWYNSWKKLNLPII